MSLTNHLLSQFVLATLSVTPTQGPKTPSLLKKISAFAPVPSAPAQAFEDHTVGSLLSKTHRLQWKHAWPRFRGTEYAATITLFASALASRVIVPSPPGTWKQGILFDDAVRDVLRVENEGTRTTLSHVSDQLQNGLIAFPFLVDAGLAAWLSDDNPDLAWQLSLMNLEALAATASIVALTKNLIGRVRPAIARCPSGDFSCRPKGGLRSFISGHSAAAFAGAGLVCAHHENLPLFGHPTADMLACAGALVAAAGSSVLRVATDNHWATDVLTGAGIGFVSGYGLPTLLHYRDTDDQQTEGRSPVRGFVQVTGLTGGLRFGAEGHASFGAELSLKQWYDFYAPRNTRIVGMELSALGRILRASGSISILEAQPMIRLWFHQFALGLFAHYRVRTASPEDVTRKAIGPALGIDLLKRRDTQIVLTGRWAPLLDGTVKDFAIGLELWLLKWLHLKSVFQHFGRRHRPTEEPATTSYLAGLGGRLPW